MSNDDDQNDPSFIETLKQAILWAIGKRREKSK
jgi:hypothetical protein